MKRSLALALYSFSLGVHLLWLCCQAYVFGRPRGTRTPTDCMSGRLIGGSDSLVRSDSLNDTRGEIHVILRGMKLSKRGEYALRALIDLGIASELGWPMLQTSELATKEKLPIKFLEQ